MDYDDGALLAQKLTDIVALITEHHPDAILHGFQFTIVIADHDEIELVTMTHTVEYE